MEFRSPYKFPDPTEMENSMPPTWIQWISREANELTLIIDQEMNETLSAFRPIPEDIEPEGEVQPDLMGFEMLQTTKEVENRGEEGNSPQEGLQEPQTQPQLEDTSTTRVNVHQTMERSDNITPRLEENNEQSRPQGTEMLQENVQEQTEQTPQNQTQEAHLKTMQKTWKMPTQMVINIIQQIITRTHHMFKSTEAKTHKIISKQAYNKPSKPLSRPSYHKIEMSLVRTHIACSTNLAKWHQNPKGYRKMEESEEIL